MDYNAYQGWEEGAVEALQRRIRLQRWVQAHPDDLGIIDAFEPLALRQMTYGQTNRVDVTEQASTPSR